MVVEDKAALFSDSDIKFILSLWNEKEVKKVELQDRKYSYNILGNLPFSITNKFYNWIESNLNKTIFHKHSFLILHKYVKGDFFDLHKDDGIRKKGKRLYAAGVNLNNNYSGGEFYVYKNNIENIIGTTPGAPYLFSSNVYHKINQIDDGVRWSILMFLFEEDFIENKKINFI